MIDRAAAQPGLVGPLEAALAYAARGWYVIPLHTPDANGVCDCPKRDRCGRNTGKHPRTMHGKDEASVDEKQIRRWFERQWPHANIGVRTGRSSGLVVVDVDPRNGGDDSLVELVKKCGQIPDTVEAITGSGGRHILFAYPQNAQVHDAKLVSLGFPGIDIKAEGGYIVAAPSLHASGERYVWEVSSHPNDVELSATPAWLIDLLSTEHLPNLPTGHNGTNGVRVPLGRPALDFVANGVPIGEQRDRAVGAARNYLSNGYTPDQTIEKVWQGLQASPQDPAQPWTYEDAVYLVRHLDASPPKPIKPLRDGTVIAPSGRVNTVTGEVLEQHQVHSSSRNGHGNGQPSGPPDPPPIDEGQDDEDHQGLPAINAAEMDLTVITPLAWEALQFANGREPRLFRRGGLPVRLELDDDNRGQPILRELTEDRMRHELKRAARFIGIVKREQKVVFAPKHVVADMLATPDPPLPVVTRITQSPAFAPDGTLEATAGYHSASRTYCALAAGLEDLHIPSQPSVDDVERAKGLIVDDVLADFPFVDQADRANAVGLGLLPFVRDMIEGPTPLHLLEAPMPGSGKGLCIDALLHAACGTNVGLTAQTRDDEEWRKRILAKLRGGYPVVQIDNLTRALDSGVLSSVLTAWPTWSDRLLGANTDVVLPVRCVWVASGNNPTMSTEVARRTIRIRIDPRVDQPWTRETFRHPELRTWVSEHRRELVEAFLTLVQSWIAAGRPRFSGRALGSFEVWTHTIGGILEHAGISGFLANSDEFYEQADIETAVWRAFVEMWWEKHQSTVVGAKELFPIASETDGLDLGNGNEKSQQTKLGTKLRAQRDRVIGRYRIVHAGVSHKSARWQLLPTNVQPVLAGDLGDVGTLPIDPLEESCSACGESASPSRGPVRRVSDHLLHDDCRLTPRDAQ